MSSGPRAVLRGRFRNWGLPLLAKELQEQSSQRRTYVIRTAYAGLLFLCAFLLFSDMFRRSNSNPFSVLGHGERMFEVLVVLQFAGIYLFMPALTCGVLTHEKERDSLALVLLTRLSPTTILLEKLASRLVVMFSFELMLLPLLGLSYTFGGVAWESLLQVCWFLALATVQAGCIALCCSAYFRTTAQAFIASYLLGAMLLFGWPLLYALGVLRLPSGIGVMTLDMSLVAVLADGLRLQTREVPFLLFVPAMYLSGKWGGMGIASTLQQIANLSMPATLTCVILFLLARFFIVRRAFVTPGNLALRAFRRLDGAFLRINRNRLTRGIVLVPSAQATPGEKPVLWRETTKTALGSASHLLRVILLLEIPTVVFFIVAPLPPRGMLVATTVMLLGALALVVLVVIVRAAGLITGERSQQTLDVLLTTPLTAREVVSQKFGSLHRTMLALSVPLLTALAYETTLRGIVSPGYRSHRNYQLTGGMYVISMVLTIGVYLLLVGWMSFYIGLRSKTRLQAMLAAVAALAGMCVLPFLLIVAPVDVFLKPGSRVFPFVMQSSPVGFLLFTEIDSSFGTFAQALLALTLNTVVYGSLCAFFRWQCLKHADHYLRR